MGSCFLGFLGAGLRMAKRRLGGAPLIIAAIVFTVSISFFALAGAPFFFIAAILGLLRTKSVEVTRTEAHQAR